MKKLIIAIDGESSSGKTTLAKKLASKIGYKHINTGSMYRAVTFAALKKKIISDSEFNSKNVIELVNELSFDFQLINGVYNMFLNGVNVEKYIRSTIVSDFVSQVSSILEVREKVVLIQRNLGIKKGIVMEGRDIGSVVFPNAELKFFITADLNERIKRRYIELNQKGIKINQNQVKNNLIKRDFLDKNRVNSPLIQSYDAIKIDNSNLTINDQILIIKSHIEKKLKKK